MPFQAIKTTVQQSYKRLNQHLASFVPRKEQNYLVAEIVKVLSGQYGVGKRILVAEAGTGIGKTLGYLAPAKQWIDQSAGSMGMAAEPVCSSVASVVNPAGFEPARAAPNRSAARVDAIAATAGSGSGAGGAPPSASMNS